MGRRRVEAAYAPPLDRRDGLLLVGRRCLRRRRGRSPANDRRGIEALRSALSSGAAARARTGARTARIRAGATARVRAGAAARIRGGVRAPARLATGTVVIAGATDQR